MPATVSAVCCGKKTVEKMAAGCKITHIPYDDGCQHQRAITRIALPGLLGVWSPNVHHDCLHNQLVSIRNRVCGETPSPTPAGLAALKIAAAKLAAMLPLTVEDDINMMPQRYSGRKRKRYEMALETLNSFGPSDRDANIKMFVNSERFEVKQSKPNPDPRAVQFRGAKYCVEIAQYLKPIEHHLYLLKGVSKGVPKTRNIAKGLNQVQRATLLIEKSQNFHDPVFIGLDASRFDKHVGVEVLKLEHGVYLSCNNNPRFAELLKKQLNNKCFSSRGIRYRVRGKRMSGDMNTALGNCIIMCIMMLAFMVNIDKWDLLDDGDDSVLIIEREDLDFVLENVKPTFRTYGFDMKVESVVYNVMDVEFCQSKIIEFQPGKFKFVRNPMKVMSTALSGLKLFQVEQVRARLLNAIGTCELVLNLGVPVLQAYSMAILRNCGTNRRLFLDPDSSIMVRVRRELQALGLKQLSKLKPQRITSEARESFATAFGVSVDDQLHWERFLEGWEFNIHGGFMKGHEVNVDNWELSVDEHPELYHL